MIGRTVAHYRILERLGGGGMGVVYKAEDTKLGRMVALKFLPPELTREADAKSRFLREARAASLLDHANICTIYEIGETEDEQTYIAMACYDGETLATRIERGAMNVEDALQLAAQIARGLRKAHDSGIVHRDIKPANVIVTSEGVAKILDFGLAKLAGATHITQSKTTLGTLAYMAPEQLAGGEVGPQADLWALGVVLFELLTGQRPFRGEYSQAVAYSILNEQPLSLGQLAPDAPAELDRIIRKLLRKDPLQRYQTAEEVLAEVEALHGPGSGSGSGSGKAGPRVTRPREALRAGARLGPYQIVEVLGSGGMGDVYRARDTRLDRQVAVKVLAPEFGEDAERKQRFQREAKTISSLSHPNICTLFDVGEQEGTDYLVMEYLEGTTLAERIAKGPLPLSELAGIGAQIGEALGKAHAQGIVHRDLKPGNVMLTKSGVVKLVDFGLAKDVGAVTSTSRHAQTPDKPITAEGAIVGTLAYMAPEQLEGYEADARSDIFALGAILYEMATGRRAFEGETKASLIAAILTAEPAQLAALRAGGGENNRSLGAIEHVVRQCLEKKAERRWQSALDVASELRWVDERVAAPSGAPPAEPSTHRRWQLAAAGLALLFIAAVGVWQWRERSLASEARAGATSVPRLTRLTWEEGDESDPSISPDGATFVYASGPAAIGASRSYDVHLRRIGGENSINLTKDFAGNDGTPSFSPDGEAIAFRSDRDGGGIFLMGATGESVRRLTDSGYGPAWSPDGREIAFRSRAVGIWAGKGENGIEIVDVASGERRRVFEGEARDLTWSPNGKRLAFSRRSGSAMGSVEICSIPVTGGKPVTVVTGTSVLSLLGLEWTRGWLWFWSATGGPHSLWRVRVDEETGARLGEAQIVFRGTDFGSKLSVSRDERRVLFSTFPTETMIVRYPFDPVREEIGTRQETILDGARGIFVYGGASPDGEWLSTYLVDHDNDEQQDILLVRVSTGETRRLTNDLLREERIVWAPDGSRLYFCAAEAGTSEIWSIRPDGSGREKVVAAISGKDIDAVIASPDGRSLHISLGERFEPHVIDLTVPIEQRRPVPLPRISETRTFTVSTWNSRWSPDGRFLTGYARDDTGKLLPELHLFDAGSRQYRKIATIEGNPVVNWLPDSSRLLLSYQSNFHVLDWRSGRLAPAGTIREGIMNVRLSADGRWVYANRSEQQFDIWMLDFGDMVPGPGNVAPAKPGASP